MELGVRYIPSQHYVGFRGNSCVQQMDERISSTSSLGDREGKGEMFIVLVSSASANRPISHNKPEVTGPVYS